MSTKVYYFSLSVNEEFIQEEDSSVKETVGRGHYGNRFITAQAVREQCGLQHVSESTIRNRIHESGQLRSYWAATIPIPIESKGCSGARNV